MQKKDRLITAAVFIIALLGVNWFLSNQFGFPSGDENIWFHGGLFVLIITYYWIEHFFTKPIDVVINGLIAFISISSLVSPPLPEWWNFLRYYAIIIAALAFAIAWAPPLKEDSVLGLTKRFGYLLVTRLGNAAIIYSAVFILSILSYFEMGSTEANVLLIFWSVLLATKYLDVGGLIRGLRNLRNKRHEEIGKVSRYFDPNIVMITILSRTSLQKGDIVSIGDASLNNNSIGKVSKIRRTVDISEAEVILLTNSTKGVSAEDSVFLITDLEDNDEMSFKLKNRNNLIGQVTIETTVSTLKYEVVSNLNLAQAHVVYTQLPDDRVLTYQVVNGKIHQEIGIDKNMRQLAIASAEQLGVWNNTTQSFASHGWLPPLNAPIYLATKDSNLSTAHTVDEYTIGNIPNTNFPVNISFDDMILYHTAILGVTGSGKSFLAYDLIEQTIIRGVKVICFDNTGDYKRYLSGSTPLVTKRNVKEFLDSDDSTLGIVDFSNIEKPAITVTNDISNCVLDWVKENRSEEDITNPKPKVLLVLEEAHTLVPEWNATPNSGLKDKVNGTSQVIFQARKYGLGFLVITQRTASVTKSILNQCNTIIAFQAFDDTGFDFMKNYMGKEYVSALPLLKPYSGVFVGKASVSDLPLIVEFTDQKDRVQITPTPAGDTEETSEASQEEPRGPLTNM